MAHILTAQDVKVRREAKDWKTFYYIVFFCFVALAVGLGLLWCRNKVTSVGYELSRATVRRDGLLEANKRLRLDLERMRSPQRIEKIASAELGLVHPSGAQIVSIR